MTRYKNIAPLFKGSTAIAYCEQSDSVAELMSIAKSETKLHLLGGVVDNQMLIPQGFQATADLPSFLTQHLILSNTLTALQTSVTNHLSYSPQVLEGLIRRIPL